MNEISVVETTFDGPYGEQIIALRYEVYVDEQKVPIEEELDKYDPGAVHFVALEDGAVVGTMRVVFMDDYARVGRLAVRIAYRRRGIGHTMMRRALDRIRERGLKTSVLDAQTNATEFYEKLGYVAEGEIFDDCGIDHIKMVRVE
jgi:predicted GNAT family N-acyltransferase